MRRGRSGIRGNRELFFYYQVLVRARDFYIHSEFKQIVDEGFCLVGRCHRNEAGSFAIGMDNDGGYDCITTSVFRPYPIVVAGIREKMLQFGIGISVKPTFEISRCILVCFSFFRPNLPMQKNIPVAVDFHIDGRAGAIAMARVVNQSGEVERRWAVLKLGFAAGVDHA